MSKFKKLFSLGTVAALSLSIVACSNESTLNQTNSKEKTATTNQTKENEEFTNVEYKNLEVKGVTLEYPNFLESTKNTDDGVLLSNKDNSINLEIKQSSNDNDLKTIFEKDIKKSNNITYKYLGKTTYSISGYENKTEYYKVVIQNKNTITTMIFTYPKEDAQKLSDIVDRVYKSFIENKREENNQLQIATVDSSGFDTGEEHPKLVVLGVYDEGKNYDIDYGSIIGKNLLNSNNIDNDLEFNTVYFMGQSVNYPNFLKPGSIPGNTKSIEFTNDNSQVELGLGYRLNRVLDNEDGSDLLRETPETELKSMEGWSTIISKEISGDYLYSISQPKEGNTEDIEFKISYFNDDAIQHAILRVNSNYYETHKDKINQIFDEMKKTYKPYTGSQGIW